MDECYKILVGLADLGGQLMKLNQGFNTNKQASWGCLKVTHYPYCCCGGVLQTAWEEMCQKKFFYINIFYI